jgi:hypothetical protein
VAVQQALTAPDVPASLVPVPAGHIALAAVLALVSTARVRVKLTGRNARPVPLDEAQLRAAIASGSFPAPVRGFTPDAWNTAAVEAWVKRQK